MGKKRRETARRREEAERRREAGFPERYEPTLQTLIDQFSDPFAFLRELAQNGIDAGTTAIDYSFELRPSTRESEKGLFILHINDDGEGMTRKIIDTELTRLWSSSKEYDWTKIGAFGIGFVSIFALRPEAVILDTGRDGEAWRIFFKADQSFDRILLDREVRGTQIQFIKEIARDRFDFMRDRTLKTLTLWCKFCNIDIRVEGERINQTFAFDAPHSVYFEEPGLRITVMPTTADTPFYGFYCKGLTLYENTDSPIPGVSFRLDYENLSHTLTRDNVIKDEHYIAGMRRVQQVVDSELRPRLFEAARMCEEPEELDGLFALLAPLGLERLPARLDNLPIIPLADGSRVSIHDLRWSYREWGSIYWGKQPGQAPTLHTEAPALPPGLCALLKSALGNPRTERAEGQLAHRRLPRPLIRAAAAVSALFTRAHENLPAKPSPVLVAHKSKFVSQAEWRQRQS